MQTFNTNKAGMSGIDREKISKVIEENTSTNYSSFSKKQQLRIDEKVLEIKNRIESATKKEKQRAEHLMTTLEMKLESCRDLSRDCVCIDMDAYFAAVEMRDDPKLRSIPMAVGGSSMLSTSNYLARRFGVRAGMPGFIAKKLCPSLRLVPGNYAKYSKISQQFSQIFLEYDPDTSMMSLDEAYIDVTDFVAQRTENNSLERKRYSGDCICWLPRIPEHEKDMKFVEEMCEKCSQTRRVHTDRVEFGIGREEIVREMRFRVEQLTGLTCSAGIAANFMLAKICSDFNKPNGQFVLKNNKDDIMDFLKDLPIRKVGGIGRVSEAHLQSLDIKTVGDMLLQKSLFPLCFSPLSQESFLRTALGLPGRPSASDPRRKSISVERTFTPTSDFEILLEEHQEICRMLEGDVRKIGLIGAKTITLKLKLSSFDVLTRSMTPLEMISSFKDIQKYSLELLEKEKGQEIRLLGVRLSQLVFEEEKKSKTIADFWNEQKLKAPLDDDDDVIIETLPCPICGCHVENRLEVLNCHVDECIRKKNEDGEEAPDLICVSVEPKKRKFTGKMENENKKAKRQGPKTIESFWKKS